MSLSIGIATVDARGQNHGVSEPPSLSAPTTPEPSAINGASAPGAPAFTVGSAPAFTPAPGIGPQGTSGAGAYSQARGPRIAEPPADASDARWNDANADRVVLVPTAATHPAGTWYLSDYDVVVVQTGYALTDRMQLSLTLTPPLSKDFLLPIDLTLKGVVARAPRVRVALLGSVSGLLGYEGGEALLGRVGGATELCFDDDCRSSVSVAADMLLAGGAIVFTDGVGAIIRANDTVAFLFELQSALPIGSADGQYNVLAGASGLRLSGRTWGVDLAAEAPLDRRTSPQLIPFVAGTYRFLP